MARFSAFVFLLITSASAYSQKSYFHQDFTGNGPFVSSNPNSGQFSHILETVPKLSFHEFHQGYMDLIRSEQDSATGGIIRVMKATPFSPNPETLFIQMKISVEEMQTNSLNAMYFYVGENFSTTNNSFPSNALMFGRFSIHFQGSTFVLRDLETQTTSKAIPVTTPITLTWVLNNSDNEQAYKLTKSASAEHSVKPKTYDLWIDDEAVKLQIPAYPGSSFYSHTKLSNFEMRFRNGVGKIRIYGLLITDAQESLAPDSFATATIYPNPASPQFIHLKADNIDPTSFQLRDSFGRSIGVDVKMESGNMANVYPKQFVSSGIYILSYYQDNRHRHVRVMVD